MYKEVSPGLFETKCSITWHKIRIMLINLKRYKPIRVYTTSLKSVNEYKLIRLVLPYAREWTLLTAGWWGRRKQTLTNCLTRIT